MTMYFISCPYKKCPMNCKSISSHRAFYAKLRYNLKCESLELKKIKSNKINYKKLKLLFNNLL